MCQKAGLSHAAAECYQLLSFYCDLESNCDLGSRWTRVPELRALGELQDCMRCERLVAKLKDNMLCFQGVANWQQCKVGADR